MQLMTSIWSLADELLHQTPWRTTREEFLSNKHCCMPQGFHASPKSSQHNRWNCQRYCQILDMVTKQGATPCTEPTTQWSNLTSYSQEGMSSSMEFHQKTWMIVRFSTYIPKRENLMTNVTHHETYWSSVDNKRRVESVQNKHHVFGYYCFLGKCLLPPVNNCNHRDNMFSLFVNIKLVTLTQRRSTGAGHRT